jgi:anti-sigma B factor antagonist
VDIAAAPEFAEALSGAIRRNDSLALIIDLTAVTCMDSTGLNALVRAFEAQRRLGGAIAVVSDDRQLITLLDLTGLNRVIRRYGTRADALRAFFGDE